MGQPTRVSVEAADPVLEAGIQSTLHYSSDVAVVAGDEAANVTVIVVDQVDQQVLNMVRATRNRPNRPEVVLLATDLVPAEALHAIAAGAHGLLRRREADVHRLTRAVLASVVGDCTMPPDLIDELLEQDLDAPGSEAVRAHWVGSGLSKRELAVLQLVADGYETDEIAQTLSYSPRTVTSIVHDITQRFRLRNRAHAVAYALRAGLL